ncbi:phosphoglucomutase/phosphomannomutase, alpha/beta/alpha domain I family protein [Mycobacterium kansasii]|uniref:Phosphoglucomutase/phosphomannomutase, alpha/beta/alpha domain I family protein n=1 Tax=Mycobacterium kansasii TaxID=1768 RepID=A0A1V3WKR2_MYCKA|nr:phosphoglucomutase/phosphomannomutase, alpha/beta/alpha domain I family protein [Mycobacterium kansasii]
MVLLPDPVPTPVVAFAVRRTGAAVGIQITASHNPATDNGYKVYLDGGIQIVSPTDRHIEAAMAAAPPADQIARKPVEPAHTDLLDHYIERAAGVRRSTGSVRVALTAMHGVGGAVAVETLRRPASPTCTPSRRSSHPTPTSPPSRSPTPRSRVPPMRCWRWPRASAPTSR